MRTGKLRHDVVIQKLQPNSPSQKSTGEPDESWVTHLAAVAASVEPLRGRELFAAQEHHSEIEVRIRIRYRSDVTAKMRVSFRSKIYDILAVINPREENVELELMCKQGVNEG